MPTNDLFSLDDEPCSGSIMVANVSFVWNSMCRVAIVSVDDAESDELDVFFRCFVADSVGFIVVGRLSRPQKTMASITGTQSISNNVLIGVIPNRMRPAYEREPMTPAPPVPDDQVDITFLYNSAISVRSLLFYN